MDEQTAHQAAARREAIRAALLAVQEALLREPREALVLTGQAGGVLLIIADGQEAQA
jgi:hypothetical protein